MVGEGNDNHRDESSSHHGEAVSDDDNHRDEGYNHGVEVVHGHSSHLKVGSHLDGTVVEIESGSDRCGGFHPESIACERRFTM